MEDDEKNKVDHLSVSRKNMEISVAEASLFPGFRFSPTDEELICHYLKKKLEGSDKCVDVIPEVDICADEPWDLPAKSIIRSDDEWFFFSPRGRKYPNGSQSKRATTSGYWKATGKERNVKSGSKIIGTKRTLVFHTGRAPKGQRTEWIMHEYCMNGKSQDLMVVCRLRKNSEFRLDANPRRRSQQQEQRQSSVLDNNCAALLGVEHSGIREGTMVGECCSKEGSSSYNSHSVEQNDSGFEWDDKIINEMSPHGSSSHWRVQEENDNDNDNDNENENERNEEDCFADIMKDDIIKLDETSLVTNPGHLQPLVDQEPESRINAKEPSSQVSTQAPASLPFQGMANRRLKLKKPKPKPQPNSTTTPTPTPAPATATELVADKDPKKSFKKLVGLSSAIKPGVLFPLVFLMILLLLYLFSHVLLFLKSNFRRH